MQSSEGIAYEPPVGPSKVDQLRQLALQRSPEIVCILAIVVLYFVCRTIWITHLIRKREKSKKTK